MSERHITESPRGTPSEKSFLSVTTLGHMLSGNLVILVFAVASVVGSVLLYGSYQTVERLSEQTIEQAMEGTEAKLEGLFSPIEKTGATIEAWGKEDEFRLHRDEIEDLNRRFRPLVEQQEQLSAMSIADAEGREYAAWQEGDTWVSRYTEAGTGDEEPSLWIRWDEDGEELERWEAVREEDARQRPWYIKSMRGEAGRAYWTEPFEFFMTDELGVTMARRFRAPSSGEPIVMALGVSLEAISEHTANIQPTENGYSAVMTPDGELIGLPGNRLYDDQVPAGDVMASWEELGLTSLGEAWKKWREANRPDTKMEGRHDEEGRYWAGFSWFELGDQPWVVATVVPRTDLTGTIDRYRNITIGFSLVAILLAGIFGVSISRRYRTRMVEIYDEAQQLGQYRLEARLGVGGMGEVYRAEHGMLKRPTAVKLLKPELYDRKSIKRFEREVQLSCRLTHPNTVTIFDYGKTDDGLFYYAMELLEGVTLDEFLDYTGPLSEGRTIFLLTQICGALVEAHDIGLIHRDIKPGNVMVGYEAGLADRITVLDFGLVKDIHAPEQTKLTQKDYLQGSPGYMAPEVILGEDADSPKVDIFAVGALGYKLLCGTRPFSGDSPVKIMMAQIEEAPPPPSEVLDREVEPRLEALIMACMEKEPRQRPDSMMEVLEELLACDAAHEWTEREALYWWEEHQEEVQAMVQEPEAVEGSQVFKMTLTMGPEGRATIDTAPQDLVKSEGVASTLPEVESPQGLGMEETLPQEEDEEGVV